MKLNLKDLVKNKYGKIAMQSKQLNQSSCCESTCSCNQVDYTVFSERYDTLNGYNPDADLGLGCGLPTEFAGIKKGNSVLDLGSGAGNDCFVARAIVGETGKVTGIDFTEEMIAKAVENNRKLGYKNVVFVKGDIEAMPLPDNEFDVIISNCVLNLVPDKNKAFSEIYRVLKTAGHFCVSDVVIKGNLPEKIRNDAEMYAGCIAGAVRIEEYINIINEHGFKNITVHKQKKISIPAEILKNYLSEKETAEFLNDEIGIFSITVSAQK